MKPSAGLSASPIRAEAAHTTAIRAMTGSTGTRPHDQCGEEDTGKRANHVPHDHLQAHDTLAAHDDQHGDCRPVRAAHAERLGDKQGDASSHGITDRVSRARSHAAERQA